MRERAIARAAFGCALQLTIIELDERPHAQEVDLGVRAGQHISIAALDVFDVAGTVRAAACDRMKNNAERWW